MDGSQLRRFRGVIAVKTPSDFEFVLFYRYLDGIPYNRRFLFARKLVESYEIFACVITNREIEYTGNPITFVIDAWDSYYSNYIYIADGNLTQTDVGTYYVVLRFYKKGAGDKGNAYWKDGSAINSDYNRESYTLSFTILPPTQPYVNRLALVVNGKLQRVLTLRVKLVVFPVTYGILGNGEYYRVKSRVSTAELS